jgi:hypothetical protein
VAESLDSTPNRLGEGAGRLTVDEMRRVDAALRLVLMLWRNRELDGQSYTFAPPRHTSRPCGLSWMIVITHVLTCSHTAHLAAPVCRPRRKLWLGVRAPGLLGVAGEELPAGFGGVEGVAGRADDGRGQVLGTAGPCVSAVVDLHEHRCRAARTRR